MGYWEKYLVFVSDGPSPAGIRVGGYPLKHNLTHTKQHGTCVHLEKSADNRLCRFNVQRTDDPLCTFVECTPVLCMAADE